MPLISTVFFAIDLSFSIFCSFVKFLVKINEASLATDWTNFLGSSENDFSVNMDKTIKIAVYGGCVTEVTGLPEGWEYEIVDHDHLEAEQNASS